MHREIKHIQTTTAFKTALKTHLFKPTIASNFSPHTPPRPHLFFFLSFFLFSGGGGGGGGGVWVWVCVCACVCAFVGIRVCV